MTGIDFDLRLSGLGISLEREDYEFIRTYDVQFLKLCILGVHPDTAVRLLRAYFLYNTDLDPDHFTYACISLHLARMLN